jgi:ribonuclease HI
MTTTRWKQASFKGKTIWAQVDESDRPVVVRGCVPIRYSSAASAKVYNAGQDGLSFHEDAPVATMPAAEAKTTSASGLGKAGRRSPAQRDEAARQARERFESIPKDTVVCFTDGACRGNPGTAGAGALVRFPDGSIAEAAKSLGHTTNNVAELTAIELAIDLVADKIGMRSPTVVFTDSRYAIGIFTQGWRAKANVALIQAIQQKLAGFSKLSLEWVAGHAGVEENEYADALANRGADGESRVRWR